jgi:hypothetical protein
VLNGHRAVMMRADAEANGSRTGRGSANFTQPMCMTPRQVSTDIPSRCRFLAAHGVDIFTVVRGYELYEPGCSQTSITKLTSVTLRVFIPTHVHSSSKTLQFCDNKNFG